MIREAARSAHKLTVLDPERFSLVTRPLTARPLGEVEQFTRPGTANVSAGDRKKLSGLLKHYARKAKPFTACFRDQIKHGLSKDHAARRCAVLKDLVRGTTKWRKGGKHDKGKAGLRELEELVLLADASGADCKAVRKLRRRLNEHVSAVVEESVEKLRVVAASLGEEVLVALAEGEPDGDLVDLAELVEEEFAIVQAYTDLSLNEEEREWLRWPAGTGIKGPIGGGRFRGRSGSAGMIGSGKRRDGSVPGVSAPKPEYERPDVLARRHKGASGKAHWRESKPPRPSGVGLRPQSRDFHAGA